MLLDGYLIDAAMLLSNELSELQKDCSPSNQNIIENPVQEVKKMIERSAVNRLS